MPEKILGFKGATTKSKCLSREAIIYALGIGMLEERHIEYLNEASSNFSVFPGYATCLHEADILSPLIDCPGIPEFNPLMILYAEHKLTM